MLETMFETLSTPELILCVVILALICFIGFLIKRKERERKSAAEFIPQDPAVTHWKQSAQENIGAQIYNRLKDVTKECIIRSGSRLHVIRLGFTDKSVDFQILIGWNIWLEGKYNSTQKLMRIIVSPREIKVEVIDSMYARLIKFKQPYIASNAPIGVASVIADVEKYLLSYHAEMQRFNDK